MRVHASRCKPALGRPCKLQNTAAASLLCIHACISARLLPCRLLRCSQLRHTPNTPSWGRHGRPLTEKIDQDRFFAVGNEHLQLLRGHLLHLWGQEEGAAGCESGDGGVQQRQATTTSSSSKQQQRQAPKRLGQRGTAARGGTSAARPYTTGNNTGTEAFRACKLEQSPPTLPAFAATSLVRAWLRLRGRAARGLGEFTADLCCWRSCLALLKPRCCAAIMMPVLLFGCWCRCGVLCGWQQPW